VNAVLETVRPAPRAIVRESHAPSAVTAVPAIYIHPGQIAVSNGFGVFSTILGSCVSVCLHDGRLGLGGINHYLLPSGGAEAEQPGRYGPTAIDELVRAMAERGGRRDQMVAYIVGGASVLAAFDTPDHLGMRNVGVARNALAEHRIPVIGVDVGGSRGRKLTFSPRDGQANVRLIGA
jgi:chemotaxis protein CheD